MNSLISLRRATKNDLKFLENKFKKKMNRCILNIKERSKYTNEKWRSYINLT